MTSWLADAEAAKRYMEGLLDADMEKQYAKKLAEMTDDQLAPVLEPLKNIQATLAAKTPGVKVEPINSRDACPTSRPV